MPLALWRLKCSWLGGKAWQKDGKQHSSVSNHDHVLFVFICRKHLIQYGYTATSKGNQARVLQIGTGGTDPLLTSYFSLRLPETKSRRIPKMKSLRPISH